ncbi:MAG: sodium:calcium exchanger, partial [Planctomycetes bacterium]|nr:sodium:calcium exchanger [Planctomycetota bacterium]
KNMVFTVSLDQVSHRGVTVDYTTVAGSALASQDFTTTSGTLTFGNLKTQTISVPIIGDAMDEENESLKVQLSNAVFASISDSEGVGTIQNDDAPPKMSIDDVSIDPEGTGGTKNAIFTVSLSGKSGKTITVNYTTADGTAKSEQDYTATNGSLTFAPGEITKPVYVSITGDALDENNTEKFYVNLSGPKNATFSDAQGTGNIIDDEILPSLSINDVQVTEGDSGTVVATFTVNLNTPSGRSVKV